MDVLAQYEIGGSLNSKYKKVGEWNNGVEIGKSLNSKY